MGALLYPLFLFMAITPLTLEKDMTELTRLESVSPCVRFMNKALDAFLDLSDADKWDAIGNTGFTVEFTDTLTNGETVDFKVAVIHQGIWISIKRKDQEWSELETLWPEGEEEKYHKALKKWVQGQKTKAVLEMVSF